MFNPVQVGKRTRYSYARIKEIMKMPHLLDLQRNSYEWFKKDGLQEIFKDISPIADFSGNLELFFEDFTFGESKYSLDECKKRDGTYAAPVRVKVKLHNKAKGDVILQEVFLGDFPIMTETGTFIINGAERVIVSQLVRSPGAYYTKEIDQTGKFIYTSQVIPNRGAWIELETDSTSAISVRIDRTRKMPLSYFLRALDFETNEQILELFDVSFFIERKLHDADISDKIIDYLSADSSDVRNTLTLGYLRRQGHHDADTFDALLKAYTQLDEKNDILSNYKYLLDTFAAIDDKNTLTAGYKALVDMLDTDRRAGEDNKEKALIGIYNRLRPGEPPSADNAANLLQSQFFDSRRYDLAAVGRYKVTKKLGWKYRLLGLKLAEDLFDLSTGELLLPADTTITQQMLDNIPDESESLIFNLQPDNARRGFYFPIPLRVKSPHGDFTMLCSPTLSINDNRTLCVADIISAISYIFNLMSDTGIKDDIDHLGNRRVRAVGELLQNQFRIGMTRMERVVRERMTTQDAEIITPQNLINIRPVVAAIKEFFGSSQLSQFMDQHNPLSELTHKRRLSALGPGGLSRERAGFEVRDVHNSHYGRMCPIETPEGPNIGLIGSLSNYARVNRFGFMETPYRKVIKTDDKNFVSNQIVYMTADEEEKFVIAQANEPLDQNDWFLNERVTARVNEETTKVPRDKVQFMDVSPKQVVSIATAMIPFLENDDANRALMGANMQRQAVPLLKTQAPLVGTGMEFKAACDSGVMILAKHPATVVEVDSNHITVLIDDFISYPLKPDFNVDVEVNQCIRANQVIAHSDSEELRSEFDGIVREIGNEGSREIGILLTDVDTYSYTSLPLVEVGQTVPKDFLLAKADSDSKNPPPLSKRSGIVSHIDSYYKEISVHVLDSDIYPLTKNDKPLVECEQFLDKGDPISHLLTARRAGTVVEVGKDTVVLRPARYHTYYLQKFVRSNQGTCINQIPIVEEGEHVDFNQPIADGPATSDGELALGYNIIVAYMPWEGYNYEDAILLSENLIKRDIFTSIHIEEYQCDARDTKLGPEEVTRDIPNVAEDSLTNLDSDGIIAIGADVRTGDILVGKVTPKGETELTAEERLLRAIFGEKAREVRDTSLRVPHGESGKVVAVNVFTRDNNDEMAPGVNKQVRVYIAQKRKISVGDKMSGRHGNKGVVSEIRRQEDMPFLPDGTPVDIVLNPLGVPSRMNIGQVFETHLGMAVRKIGLDIHHAAMASVIEPLERRVASLRRQLAHNPSNHLEKELLDSNKKLAALYATRSKREEALKRNFKAFGFDVDSFGLPKPSKAGVHIATPVFDGAREDDLMQTIALANLDPDGKTVLFDGRTGLPFENRVTVGCVYMLKLHHLVDDKIHARSTGPYSLVTQQPLGGKAQFGGQRFGEMEVWALEAYGASYTLQEILTVKSDDVVGRVKAYEAIVKGQNIPEPGVPESFKVLIKELQSIGLDIRVLSRDSKEIIIHDDDDDDDRSIKNKADDLGVDVGSFAEHELKADEPPADDDIIADDESNLDDLSDEEIDAQLKNLGDLEHAAKDELSLDSNQLDSLPDDLASLFSRLNDDL